MDRNKAIELAHKAMSERGGTVPPRWEPAEWVIAAIVAAYQEGYDKGYDAGAADEAAGDDL